MVAKTSPAKPALQPNKRLPTWSKACAAGASSSIAALIAVIATRRRSAGKTIRQVCGAPRTIRSPKRTARFAKRILETMTPSPTPLRLGDDADRQAAVATFDRNLVVTAGAGTGKTTLLIDRRGHLLLRNQSG